MRKRKRFLSTLWGHSEKAAICKPRKESLSELEHAGTLILNFQTPEVWDINVCLNHPVYGIWLWQPLLALTSGCFFPRDQSLQSPRNKGEHDLFKEFGGCQWGWWGKLRLDLQGELPITLRLLNKVSKKMASVSHTLQWHPRIMGRPERTWGSALKVRQAERSKGLV